MALPTEVPMPSYIIYREALPGQAVTDAAPLVFWPPKDSDELFDALRIKYPHLRTHSERMREAVFEFLLDEQAPQLQTEQLPTPQMTNSALTSPWEASMQSMSSGSSAWGSPETFGFATPTFGNSPQPQAQQLSRQLSTATEATVPDNPTPPALEQMTGVFSLSDTAQPKQRIRRKMTEAEKVEYRKRRIVKACEKCSKRKRKCHHNQPEMECVGATKSHKVSKPPATPTFKKLAPLITPPQTQHQDSIFGANAMDIGDSFVSDGSAHQFTEYSALVEDPLPDMSLEDLLSTAQPQWPWSDTPDWTLMDFDSDGFATTDLTHKKRPEHERDLRCQQPEIISEHLSDPNEMPDLNINQFPRDPGFDGDDSIVLQGWPGRQWVLQEQQKTRQTTHAQSAEGHDMSTFHGVNQSMWTGRADDKEEMQIQDMDQKSWRRRCEPPSLAQMTLRLTATAKAVKAFGKLLPANSPSRTRLQATSLRKIALIALGGLAVAQQNETLVEPNARGLATTHPCTACGGNTSFAYPKDLHRHEMRMHSMSSTIDGSNNNMNTSYPYTGNANGGLLDCMSIEDYLRMQTNRSPIQEDRREAVSITPAGRNTLNENATTSIVNPTANTERGIMSKGLGRHPSLGCSGAEILQQQSDSAAQQGRPMPSLGEGITTSESPSTELFMLKRRIPNAFHSVVDRNSPSAGLGPLLTTIPENVDTCTEGNATLRNGGAYQTLDAGNHNTAVLAGGLSVIENAFRPLHTRPQNQATPNFEGDTNHTHGGLSSALTRTAPIVADAHAQTVASATSVQPSGMDVELYSSADNKQDHIRECQVYEFRLKDTMRRRDHFGRPLQSISGLLSLLSLAALVATFVFLSRLPTSNLSLSFLLLALISPLSDARVTDHAGSTQSVSQLLGRISQCASSCKSWLADDVTVQNHAPSRIYVQKLLCRGRRQDTRITGTLWRKGAGKKVEPLAVV